MAHDRDVAVIFRENHGFALKFHEQLFETNAQDAHAALGFHEQVSQAMSKENSTQTSLRKGVTQTTPQKQPERTMPREHFVQTADQDQIIQGSLEKQQVRIISNEQHIHAIPKEQPVRAAQKERPVQMTRKERRAQATLQEQLVQASPKEKSVQVDLEEEPVQIISNKQSIQASAAKQPGQASLQQQTVKTASIKKTVQVALQEQPVQTVQPVQMTRKKRRAQATSQEQKVQANPKGRLVPAISKELLEQAVQGEQHAQVISEVQLTTEERLAQVFPEVESIQAATKDRPWTAKFWPGPLQMNLQKPNVHGLPTEESTQTATSYTTWTMKLWQHLFQKTPQKQPITNNDQEQATQHNTREGSTQTNHQGRPVNIICQLNTLNPNPRKQFVDRSATGCRPRLKDREQPKNGTGRDLVKRLRRSLKFNKAISKSSFSKFLRQRNGFFGTRVFHFLAWLRGETRDHFGPTCRIPDLFLRRDKIFFDLSSERLRWFLSPPPMFHDIFAVAKKVHQIEETIGYEFKNKMLIVEALKMSGITYLLYFNGTVHPVENNNRLALLGDRALSLSLTETWFHGGSSTKEYTSMNLDTITRASLAARGRKIGLDASILIVSSLPSANLNQVAETFEAILGAVYVDSGNRLGAVTDIIQLPEMDNHFRKGAGDAPKLACLLNLLGTFKLHETMPIE